MIPKSGAHLTGVHSIRFELALALPDDHEIARRLAAAILEQPLANARDFDDLHAYVRRAAKRVHGIGELAIYDVALRIGWFGRMEPTRVYLHAGTREGARALGLDVSGASLARAVFPAAMQELSAAEIEDFMCIYKAQLGRFRVRRDATSA